MGFAKGSCKTFSPSVINGMPVGPADLASFMGYPGNPGHPEVQEAIIYAMRRIRAAGKPAGFLSQEMLETVVYEGCAFATIDIDIRLSKTTARGRFDACKRFSV